MANSVDYQVTENGPRNVVIKLTGVLDTSDVSELPAITLANFADTNTQTQASMGTLTGFRIDLIEYAISNGLEVVLSWASNTPQQIFPLSGRGKFASYNYGGFIPDTTRSGYTGDINLTTSGYIAGSVQNFSIVLELIKLYKN